MVDRAREQIQAAGESFWPLREPADLATFIDVEACLPCELPQHNERLFVELRRRGAEYLSNAWGAGHLLVKLLAIEPVRALIELIRHRPREPEETIILISPATTCVSCGNSERLTVDKTPSHPAIYSGAGRRSGEMYGKTCGLCGAHHGMSRASGGHIPPGHVRPIPDCLDQPYFQVYSNVYSVPHVMLRYQTQATHSHTAFSTFCHEYCALTGADMDRIVFSATYFVYALIGMLHEAGVRNPDLQVQYQGHVEGETPLDRTLRSYMPLLHRWFVRKWAGDHATYCRQPGRCNCWIGDGHMKCRRTVCENKAAREIDMGALGTAVLGCTHTPLPGSRFCYHCRPAAANLRTRTRGPTDSPDGE